MPVTKDGQLALRSDSFPIFNGLRSMLCSDPDQDLAYAELVFVVWLYVISKDIQRYSQVVAQPRFTAYKDLRLPEAGPWVGKAKMYLALLYLSS